MYDLSAFPHHIVEENKPYRSVYAESEEQYNELAQLLDAKTVINTELNKLREYLQQQDLEKRALGFSQRVPVGKTPDEQVIFIALQVVVSNGGKLEVDWQTFVCEPDGIAELERDFDEQAQMYRAHLANIVGGMNGSN